MKVTQQSLNAIEGLYAGVSLRYQPGEKEIPCREQTWGSVSARAGAGTNCTERTVWAKHITCSCCARKGALTPSVSLGVCVGPFFPSKSSLSAYFACARLMVFLSNKLKNILFILF